MNRSSHNLVMSSMDGMNPWFQKREESFDFESVARKLLRFLRFPKEWSDEINVSHQLVNRWIGGAPIPTEKMFKIAVESKKYFLSTLRPLETENDLMLLLKYGQIHRRRNDSI